MTVKKALIVTTVSGFVPQFEMNNVKILQSLNCEVHYATNYKIPVYGKDNNRLNDTGIIRHQIDFVRSPFRFFKNIIAYKQLVKLMKIENYDIVHCHTPMGGVIARLASKKTKTSPIIYTVHGFHFYKGAPLFNWILFFPIEKWLARYTDVLITINKEDYEIAKKFKLKDNGKVAYINGVGIDLGRFNNSLITNEKKRFELNLSLDTFIITSVGELNSNKNQQVIIKALKKLAQENIIYLLCGQGKKKQELQKLCKKLNLNDKVVFLGHREDIPEILAISDCFAFPSFREGLGMAAIEAMASGIPIITTKNRGTKEYAEEGKTGFLCNAYDIKSFENAITRLYNNPVLCKKFGDYNKIKVQKFNIKNIEKVMSNLYISYL